MVRVPTCRYAVLPVGFHHGWSHDGGERQLQVTFSQSGRPARNRSERVRHSYMRRTVRMIVADMRSPSAAARLASVKEPDQSAR